MTVTATAEQFHVIAFSDDHEHAVRDNWYDDRERALEVAWKIATYHDLDVYVTQGHVVVAKYLRT